MTNRRDTLMDVTASLAAAISLLEQTPQAKNGAASDYMFQTMLTDYRKSLERARKALAPIDNTARGHRRRPPAYGAYPAAALALEMCPTPGGYHLRFIIPDAQYDKGITAEQAREAAHLLNQLAEYLEQ